jgi:hypothetical protein
VNLPARINVGLGACWFPAGSWFARVICQEIPIQVLPVRIETAPPAPTTAAKLRPIDPADVEYPGYYTGWTPYDIWETEQQRKEAIDAQIKREITAGAYAGGATIPEEDLKDSGMPTWVWLAAAGLLAVALVGGRR